MEHVQEPKNSIDTEKIVADLERLTAAISDGTLSQNEVDTIADATDKVFAAINESHGITPDPEAIDSSSTEGKILELLTLARKYSVEKIKKHLFGTGVYEKTSHEAVMAILHDMIERGLIAQYNGQYMSPETATIIKQVIRDTRVRRLGDAASTVHKPQPAKRVPSPEEILEQKIRAAGLGSQKS